MLGSGSSRGSCSPIMPLSARQKQIVKDPTTELNSNQKTAKAEAFVTPPSDTDRSLEWHEILHHWNDRARAFTEAAGVKPWSYLVCKHYWKSALHIANLPEHRWVRGILAWNPSVRYRSLGRRPHTWDYQINAFCRYKGLGSWLEEAKFNFCEMSRESVQNNVHNIVFLFTACAQNGLALWRAGIDH